MANVAMICCICRKTTVLRAAWAQWDKQRQKWMLQNVVDAAYCTTCEGVTNIIERRLPMAHKKKKSRKKGGGY